MIQRQLEENNYTMQQYGLPEPEPDDRTEEQRLHEDLIPPVLDPQTGDPIDMSDEERLARARGMYEQLNAQQRAAIDLIFERDRELRSSPSRVTNTILLEGAAGTGKTFTLNVLIELCYALRIPILRTHWQGGDSPSQRTGRPLPRHQLAFGEITSCEKVQRLQVCECAG
jgi:hypothetical protein